MDYKAQDYWQSLFDHTYLRWFDLNDQPALCEVVKVEREEMIQPGEAGKKKTEPVMYYKQVQGSITDAKPLVLNKTNAGLLAKIAGNYASAWTGTQIVLYPTTTRLGKEQVPCIRIRAPKEQQKN